MREKFVSRKNIYTTVILVLILVGSIFIKLKTNAVLDQKQNATIEAVKNETASNYFEGVQLTAKSAFVYDVNNKKVLYEKNADAPLPLASISKIMTAIIADEVYSNKKIITISDKTLGIDGDNSLHQGERWNVKDLLSYTLMVSSNDGAQNLANALSGLNASSTDKDSAFVSKMNEKAINLGLSTMHFQNPTGLDAKGETNALNFSSAKDVALLFEYGLTKHPELFDTTKYSSRSFSSETTIHKAVNTNIITNKIPNLLAGKTGYTDIAGGNLVVLFDKGLNEPVIIVVLGSTQNGRFSDVLSLASSTIASYNTD